MWIKLIEPSLSVIKYQSKFEDMHIYCNPRLDSRKSLSISWINIGLRFRDKLFTSTSIGAAYHKSVEAKEFFVTPFDQPLD